MADAVRLEGRRPAPDARMRLHSATWRAPERPAATVTLPELTREERANLLEEAVLEVYRDQRVPLTDLEEEVWHARVGALYGRLCIFAREQKASPEVRAKLIARRMARRWTVPGRPL